METSNHKTTATFSHLSALTQYFIPFGNFIFPIIIWSSAKKNSEFADHHGRQIINFQLSLFLYSLLLFIIAVPIFLTTLLKNIPFQAMATRENIFVDDFSPANITGLVSIAIIALVIFFFLKVAEFFLIIVAAVKAANGEHYYYPLTINFIGKTITESTVSATEHTHEPQPEV